MLLRKARKMQRILMFFSVTLIAFVVTDALQAESSAVDLTTWQQVGESVWQFDENGVSAGPSEKAGYLVSTAQYDDFRLSVEFRIEDDTNSGIFVLCEDASQIEGINADKCFEANIWDNHPNQDFRTGSIVKRVVPIARVDSIGRWNQFEIVVSESSMSVVLNGVLTARLADDRLRRGAIAIQYAGKGILKFRNLKIEPL